MKAARFPWILTLVVAAAVAVLLALGVWQVRRLAWKSALIASAEAAAERDPAPLAQVVAEGAPEFRRVIVDCPGLSSAPYVELQSISDGQAGVRLVSACPAAGATWLVDRGFVGEAISARPSVARSAVPTRLTAVVRTPSPPGPMAPPPQNGRFFARDAAAMARALGAQGPVAPQTLYALTSTNPEWLALRPSAPPPAFSNNHLGYALTWFGLAAALIAIYGVMLRGRLRAARP